MPATAHLLMGPPITDRIRAGAGKKRGTLVLLIGGGVRLKFFPHKNSIFFETLANGKTMTRNWI
jgi:hypothetical protein